MLDIVQCEYELPLPEDLVEKILHPPDWQEFEFYTDSFPGAGGFLLSAEVDRYTISEDGQIYKKIVEREMYQAEDGAVDVKETDKGIERMDYTGEIILFGQHEEEAYDFSLEIKILFWKGELRETSFSKWKKQKNEKRKERIEELTQYVKKCQEKQESYYYKVIQFFKYIIGGILNVVKILLNLIAKLIWKIESWIE